MLIYDSIRLIPTRGHFVAFLVMRHGYQTVLYVTRLVYWVPSISPRNQTYNWGEGGRVGAVYVCWHRTSGPQRRRTGTSRPIPPLSFKAYKLQQLSYSVLKNNVRFSIIENLHIIPCFLILGKRRCYGDRGQ